MKLVSPTGRPIRLKPNRATAARKAAYYKRLHKIIERMRNDVEKGLIHAYRRADSEITQDASAIAEMRQLIKSLTAEWSKVWRDESGELARWFVNSTQNDAEKGFGRTLKQAGFTVPFKPTRRIAQVMGLAVQENVELIRSIGTQYLKDVGGAVLRSAMAGRDLSTLTDEIESKYGIARRKAATIARDQNNKITAVVNRERRLDLGIDECEWKHSGASKKPRPSHVTAGRERLRFNTSQGAFIDGAYIQPGEEINCGCVAIPIIPGWKD